MYTNRYIGVRMRIHTHTYIYIDLYFNMYISVYARICVAFKGSVCAFIPAYTDLAINTADNFLAHFLPFRFTKRVKMAFSHPRRTSSSSTVQREWWTKQSTSLVIRCPLYNKAIYIYIHVHTYIYLYSQR